MIEDGNIVIKCREEGILLRCKVYRKYDGAEIPIGCCNFNKFTAEEEMFKKIRKDFSDKLNLKIVSTVTDYSNPFSMYYDKVKAVLVLTPLEEEVTSEPEVEEVTE